MDIGVAVRLTGTKGTPQVHEKPEAMNEHKTQGQFWRRGWDLNPRMEVLQTSPLGLLGTAPELRSIAKLPSTCQLPRRSKKFSPTGCAAPIPPSIPTQEKQRRCVLDWILASQGKELPQRDGVSTTCASRMNRADSSGGVGQM